jgi:hypothetical protein
MIGMRKSHSTVRGRYEQFPGVPETANRCFIFASRLSEAKRIRHRES